jgi:hypothetical protein
MPVLGLSGLCSGSATGVWATAAENGRPVLPAWRLRSISGVRATVGWRRPRRRGVSGMAALRREVSHSMTIANRRLSCVSDIVTVFI